MGEYMKEGRRGGWMVDCMDDGRTAEGMCIWMDG